MNDAKYFADEAIKYYQHVLKLDENDVETHYQLSLLYLTQLETTLLESIDNIESTLAMFSVQIMCKDICGNNNLNIDGLNNNNKRKYYYDYPIGRGIYSPWYNDRNEIKQLCQRHIDITFENVNEFDSVLFGGYITQARLLYIETVEPICYPLTIDQRQEKLLKGIEMLENALKMNKNDPTLHHDMGLLLSHQLIGKYEEAIKHWKYSISIDNNNPP